MDLRPEQQLAVRQAIRQYLQAPRFPCYPHCLVEMARRLEILPVYSDMGGTLFIRPTGEVLVCVGDSETNISVESNPRWITIAYVHGAGLYPSLAFLLPPRPAQAKDCELCVGNE